MSPAADPTPPPAESHLRTVDAAAAKRLLEEALETPAPSSGNIGWKPPGLEELSPLFAKYRINRLIGRGGMGAVYLGTDPNLDRPVAIKILPAELGSLPGFADRFRREAWALAQLQHPHIVHIYEFGATTSGHLFFVMEYVEGASLSDLMARRRNNDTAVFPLPPRQALEIARQVCEALACTHAQGILHRDIKPANILMDATSHIKLVDFGLARPIHQTRPTSQLTGTGELMGTRDYMAPELLDGHASDARVDVYAVGVLLYEMLTGQLPRGAFLPPSHFQPLDPRLDRLILKALQSAPERRFASIRDLGEALQPFCRSGGGPPRKWPRLAGFTAAAAVGTAVYLKLNASPSPVSPSPEHALLFEESFDFPPGEDGLLQSPYFTVEGTYASAADITETGLNYTDPEGNVLTTRGKAAQLDTPDEESSVSHVAALSLPDHPGSQLWISFLARQTAGTNERFFNLCLRAVDNACQPPDGDLSVDEVLAIGMRSRLGPQVWQVWDRTTTGDLSRAAVSSQPTTETSFLLVRWEKDAGGLNERATLWVNPPLGRDPATPAGFSFTSDGSDVASWNQLRELRIGAGHAGKSGGHSTGCIMDEIRLGWTREAVTPHTPPAR